MSGGAESNLARQIEVQLFAAARDLAGAARVTLPVAQGLPAAQVRSLLAERWPQLAPLLARCRLAVDQHYVADDALVRPGAEVALIPPVSGG